MKTLQNIGRTLLTLAAISLFIIFFAFLGMRAKSVWEMPQPVIDVPALLSHALHDTWEYGVQLAGGDLGEVELVAGPQDVGDLLKQATLNSLGLISIALSLATVLGLGGGVLAALAKNQRRTWLVLLLTLAGIAAPAFFLALLLQSGGIWYSRHFGKALVSMGGYAWDVQHMLMPVIVLTIRPLAHLTRATFISLRDIATQDYIRTAQAKGLRPRHILWGHMLRNLMVPFLAAEAVAFRMTLGILPIVEFVFAWPGLGLRALQAVRQNLPPLFIAVALVMGLTMYLLHDLLSALNRLLDPRLRVNE